VSALAGSQEQKKVAKLKARQKAKMEQTLLFEIKSQQAEQQHLANLAEQNARAERERKARERRKRQVEDNKRNKEMERKRQEELDTRLRRKQAMQQYAKEQEMNRLLALKEKARQREQDRRNAELKEKQAQHRREMQEAYEQELRDQAKRQANMEEAERARMARVAVVAKAAADAKALKNRQKREKIEGAFKQQEKMMQQKWQNFEDKMAAEDQRKAEWDREKAQNAERTRMRAEESANYIAGVQAKNDALEQGKKDSIDDKNRRAQENRDRMKRERDYRNALKREQQLQKRMDKLFHLERSQRIADYRKELAWQKMRRSDARTGALESRKHQLLNERRKMRDLNRDVRVNMQTSMEEFRCAEMFTMPFVCGRSKQECCHAGQRRCSDCRRASIHRSMTRHCSPSLGIRDPVVRSTCRRSTHRRPAPGLATRRRNRVRRAVQTRAATRRMTRKPRWMISSNSCNRRRRRSRRTRDSPTGFCDNKWMMHCMLNL